MARKIHIFAFAGGRYLNTMGASWFVSYSYFDNIDINHLNWRNVSRTCATRMEVYLFTKPLHRFWLEKVLKMKNWCLRKNKLNLSPEEVKSMAQKLLLLPEVKHRVYPCVRWHVNFWKEQYEFLLQHGTEKEKEYAEINLHDLTDSLGHLVDT